MPEEVQHIHGTPLLAEPQSTKELFKWTAGALDALSAKVDESAERKAVSALETRLMARISALGAELDAVKKAAEQKPAAPSAT